MNQPKDTLSAEELDALYVSIDPWADSEQHIGPNVVVVWKSVVSQAREALTLTTQLKELQDNWDDAVTVNAELCAENERLHNTLAAYSLEISRRGALLKEKGVFAEGRGA